MWNDPVLVELFDEDDGEDGGTYVVHAVQYDERVILKYYEATCVRVGQGESWPWAVPSSSFVAGRKLLNECLMVACTLMN